MKIYLAGTSVSDPDVEFKLCQLFQNGFKLHSYYHCVNGFEKNWFNMNIKNKVDLFLDSGGVHAAVCVTIAYARPVILKFAFGMTYEHQTVKFSVTEFGQRITYFSIIILIHHLILFSLEIFNASKIILILKKSFFSSIFTILLCLLITILFSRKNK